MAINRRRFMVVALPRLPYYSPLPYHLLDQGHKNVFHGRRNFTDIIGFLAVGSENMAHFRSYFIRVRDREMDARPEKCGFMNPIQLCELFKYFLGLFAGNIQNTVFHDCCL